MCEAWHKNTSSNIARFPLSFLSTLFGELGQRACKVPFGVEDGTEADGMRIELVTLNHWIAVQRFSGFHMSNRQNQ